jgi:hypothetical protein
LRRSNPEGHREQEQKINHQGHQEHQEHQGKTPREKRLYRQGTLEIFLSSWCPSLVFLVFLVVSLLSFEQTPFTQIPDACKSPEQAALHIPA